MTQPDLDTQLASIGRGIVQANMKLSRIAECVERGPVTGTNESPALEALLDLVDAVDRALTGRKPARGWFRRPGQEDLWEGLELARRAAVERLGREGIEAVVGEGAVDPLVHRVVEIVPSASTGGAAGEIARVHRQGWVQRRGEERRVLRTAEVAAFGRKG